jgi:pimeloyl-ACP methyl ester carboxylesterase
LLNKVFPDQFQNYHKGEVVMASSCLDHPVLAERFFYAWPNYFQEPFHVAGKRGRLGCWYGLWFPKGVTVIHFHGNGETVGDYLEDFAGRMRALGANLLLAEYRGYGMSEGEPRLAAMLEDIPPIVAASNASSERLIFFGRSLGSLYALHAASLYPHAAGLVLESAIADPLEQILARVEPRQVGVSPETLRAEVDRLFNQKEKLVAFTGRTLVMHTRNDELVDSSHAERLYQWANQPKELVIFERGGHNNIMEINTESYFAHIERLIAACER